MLPISPRWRASAQAERERVLRMEFRSFVNRLILVPAQILRTGRTLVFRLLATGPDLPVLFRLLDAPLNKRPARALRREQLLSPQLTPHQERSTRTGTSQGRGGRLDEVRRLPFHFSRRHFERGHRLIEG
ncbi:MAG: hypothetical protein IPG04_36845 [Polyangiaceae bacterium]|nr:hypothetical protein [Polyangiaceae bacterium]